MRTRVGSGALALVVLAGCSVFGAPPMEPLTAAMLRVAEERWEAHGSDSYHLVVRVKAPRVPSTLYDLVVDGRRLVRLARNGQSVSVEEAEHCAYSIPGLFALLRTDLRLTDRRPLDNLPPVDLRALFEPDTGRLMRYRRTVGSERRRVLFVEVLQYEPFATGAVAAG
jgi:hypothetical protein